VGKRPSVFGGKENINIKPEKHVSHMPEVRLLHHLHFVYLIFLFYRVYFYFPLELQFCVFFLISV
jgi:hypothetical protein